MVKTQSDTCEFDHPWGITVEGAFNKYPNEFQPNVKSLDILDRRLNDNGELVTEKLLRSKFIPNVLMRKSMAALGMPVLLTQTNLEQSLLSLPSKTYTMRTINNTYLEYMKVDETLVYRENSETNAAQLTQTTSCDMYAKMYPWLLQWAVNLGEKAVISEVKSNIPKGRSAMNAVIPGLIQEFENIAQMTDEAIKRNFENAENFIKTCGDETIQNFEQFQVELKAALLKVERDVKEQTSQIVAKSSTSSSSSGRKRLISEGSLAQIQLETEKLVNEALDKAAQQILELLAKIKEMIQQKQFEIEKYRDSLNLRQESEGQLMEIISKTVKDLEAISLQGAERLNFVDISNNREISACVEKLKASSLASLRKSMDCFEAGLSKGLLKLESRS